MHKTLCHTPLDHTIHCVWQRCIEAQTLAHKHCCCMENLHVWLSFHMTCPYMIQVKGMEQTLSLCSMWKVPFLYRTAISRCRLEEPRNRFFPPTQKHVQAWQLLQNLWHSYRNPPAVMHQCLWWLLLFHSQFFEFDPRVTLILTRSDGTFILFYFIETTLNHF